MQRQTRNTWILVGVVVVLGLAAVAEELRERRLSPGPLVPRRFDDVRQIELRCPACPTRRLERAQGRWDLIEPFVAPADAATVARLVALGAAPAQHPHPRSDFSPERIGLAPPLGEIVLGSQRFEFGGTDALTGARYVAAGDRVGQIADRYSVLLLAPPERFIERTPFSRLANPQTVEFGGVALAAEARAALLSLEAEPVLAAPATLLGTLRVTHGRGRESRYAVEQREQARWLRPEGAPYAFVLPTAAAGWFPGDGG